MSPGLESDRPSRDGLLLGVGAMFALDLLAAGIAFAVNGYGGGYGILFFIGFFGLFQLAWGLPLVLLLKLQRKPMAMRGALLSVGIAFLLNAGCVGFTFLMN